MKRPKSASDSGFTLIEVMIASIFFVIVTGAIYQLQVAGSINIARAQTYEKATSLLMDIQELIQVLSPQQIQSLLSTANTIAYDRQGQVTQASSPTAFFTLSASIIPSSDTYKHMAVTMSWQDVGLAGVRQIVTDTLVTLP